MQSISILSSPNILLLIALIGIVFLLFVIYRLRKNSLKFTIWPVKADSSTDQTAEERLYFSEFALDNVKQSVIMIDAEGNVVYMNTATRQILNRRGIGHKNLKLWDISPDVPQSNWSFFFQYMRDYKYRIISSEVETPIGKLYLERHASYAKYGDKEFVITDTLDLTSHYKAQEIVKQSEERYKTLVAMSPNPILVTRKFRICYLNPAAIVFFGYTTEKELLGDNFIHFIDPHDRKKVPGQSAADINYSNCEAVELNIVRKDGEHRTILSAIQPIDYEGEPALMFVIQDITQKKLYESELFEAKKKAEESDMLKTAFLANMSHEIRTPLNGIIGFSGLLQRPNLDKDRLNKYASVINASSHQLLAIINDIIDISKIEAGQIEINPEMVDISILNNEIVSIYRSLAEKKGLLFNYIANLPEGMVTISDETKLKQILNNLLNNASKFTQFGSIDMCCELKGHEIQYMVSDTGIGIPEKFQQLIFERFRQVEIANNKQYGGTGLGLSISKALVELLGGKIWVESAHSKGTTFFFTIPYKPVDNIKKIQFESNGVEHTYNWTNKTILVAEDESANYYFIKELLADTGANLIYAENGRKAIEYFRSNKAIDLVLLDIKMPDMDGYQALLEIKKIKNSIKIVAQTAFAMSGDREKALNAGFDDYVAKPIDQQILLNTMSKYL